jgi:Na+-translocating ferredoxin:NAD+ oxidoreductase RnfD subunit
MLLYGNDRLGVIAFATALGVASKTLIRVPVGPGRVRHCLNPSNTGIALTLLLFPWVGISPPYQFTENLSGVGDWLLPAVIIVSGTFLNTRFTERVPLILAWLEGFALQADVRSLVQGTPMVAAVLPVTGMAFLLFTFYMVTDPATTPAGTADQLAFGGAVALAYGVLTASHVVFGLFFSLLAVCSARGAILVLVAAVRSAARSRVGQPVPARMAITRSAALEVAE